MIQTKRRAVQGRLQKCVAIFSGSLLVAFAYSHGHASGILYSKLLEPRTCTSENATNVSETNLDTEPRRSTSAPTTTSSGQSQTTPLGQDLEEQEATKGCGGLGEGTSATVWVSSIYISVRCFIAPLGGILLDTFGSRGAAKISATLSMVGFTASIFASSVSHLYYTAALSGVGGGMGIIIGFRILNLVFPKRYDVVAGIAGVSIGTMTVIFSFCSSYVMEKTNWRGYFFVIDTVVLITFVLIVALPKDMLEVAEMPHLADRHRFSRFAARFSFSASEFAKGFRRAFALYRDPGFHLMNISMLLYSFGFFFPFVFVAERAKEFGADNSTAYRQVAVIGGAAAVGSLLNAISLNRLQLRPLMSQGLCLIGMGCAVILHIATSNYYELLATMAVFSLFAGSAVSLMSGAAEQAIQKKQLVSHSYGHLLLFDTIPMLLGTPFAAFLHKQSNTYTVPYVTGGIILLSAGLLQGINDRRQQALERRIQAKENYKGKPREEAVAKEKDLPGPRRTSINNDMSDGSLSDMPMVSRSLRIESSV